MDLMAVTHAFLVGCLGVAVSQYIEIISKLYA